LLNQIAADEAGAAGDDDHFLWSMAMLLVCCSRKNTSSKCF